MSKFDVTTHDVDSQDNLTSSDEETKINNTEDVEEVQIIKPITVEEVETAAPMILDRIDITDGNKEDPAEEIKPKDVEVIYTTDIVDAKDIIDQPEIIETPEVIDQPEVIKTHEITDQPEVIETVEVKDSPETVEILVTPRIAEISSTVEETSKEVDMIYEAEEYVIIENEPKGRGKLLSFCIAWPSFIVS